MTLSAKPCIVRPFVRRTPIAQTLRRVGRDARVEPHAGEPLEPAGVRHAQLGERVDHEPLDVAHVTRRAEAVVEVEDRVADELPGPVIGDVAAALDRDELGADRRRLAAQVGGRVRPRRG